MLDHHFGKIGSISKTFLYFATTYSQISITKKSFCNPYIQNSRDFILEKKYYLRDTLLSKMMNKVVSYFMLSHQTKKKKTLKNDQCNKIMIKKKNVLNSYV